MHLLTCLLIEQPLIALTYFAGQLKIGQFVLGGIAGTLLVGVAIGQLGEIKIDCGMKDIFFGLFIYGIGFQGGAQFFHALNRRLLNRVAFTTGFRKSSC